MDIQFKCNRRKYSIFNGNKIVLEEGLTIGRKKLREHLEVINHAEAIDYIESLIEQQIVLDEKIIKNVHYLMLKGIDNENAGRYRQINVGISGSQHQPPHFWLFRNK